MTVISAPQPAPQPAQAAPGTVEHPALAALVARSAHKLDPVRWAYLQALAQRTAQQHSELREHLQGRLAQAVAAYTQAFESASAAAQTRCAHLCQQFPQATAALNQHCAHGDFTALARLAAQLQAQAQPQPLADLVRHIQSHSSALDPAGNENTVPATAAAAAAAPGADKPAAPQLRALRLYKDTWARLSTDQQLARSLAQVPDNPGPLNSQLLVLRSLRLMQDTAPAYLHHFLGYAKTLMWLEQRAAAVAAPTAPSLASADVAPTRRAAPDPKAERTSERTTERTSERTSERTTERKAERKVVRKRLGAAPLQPARSARKP